MFCDRYILVRHRRESQSRPGTCLGLGAHSLGIDLSLGLEAGSRFRSRKKVVSPVSDFGDFEQNVTTAKFVVADEENITTIASLRMDEKLFGDYIWFEFMSQNCCCSSKNIVVQTSLDLAHQKLFE